MGPAARALAAQQAQRRRHLAVVTQPADGSAEEKAHEAGKAAATQAAVAATAEGGAAALLAEEQPRACGAAAASGCRQQAAIMQRLHPTACLLQQLRGGAAWAGPGRLQHGRGLPAGWRKELPCPPPAAAVVACPGSPMSGSGAATPTYAEGPRGSGRQAAREEEAASAGSGAYEGTESSDYEFVETVDALGSIVTFAGAAYDVHPSCSDAEREGAWVRAAAEAARQWHECSERLNPHTLSSLRERGQQVLQRYGMCPAVEWLVRADEGPKPSCAVLATLQPHERQGCIDKTCRELAAMLPTPRPRPWAALDRLARTATSANASVVLAAAAHGLRLLHDDIGRASTLPGGGPPDPFLCGALGVLYELHMEAPPYQDGEAMCYSPAQVYAALSVLLLVPPKSQHPAVGTQTGDVATEPQPLQFKFSPAQLLWAVETLEREGEAVLALAHAAFVSAILAGGSAGARNQPHEGVVAAFGDFAAAAIMQPRRPLHPPQPLPGCVISAAFAGLRLAGAHAGSREDEARLGHGRGLSEAQRAILPRFLWRLAEFRLLDTWPFGPAEMSRMRLLLLNVLVVLRDEAAVLDSKWGKPMEQLPRLLAEERFACYVKDLARRAGEDALVLKCLVGDLPDVRFSDAAERLAPGILARHPRSWGRLFEFLDEGALDEDPDLVDLLNVGEAALIGLAVLSALPVGPEALPLSYCVAVGLEHWRMRDNREAPSHILRSEALNTAARAMPLYLLLLAVPVASAALSELPPASAFTAEDRLAHMADVIQLHEDGLLLPAAVSAFFFNECIARPDLHASKGWPCQLSFTQAVYDAAIARLFDEATMCGSSESPQGSDLSGDECASWSASHDRRQPAGSAGQRPGEAGAAPTHEGAGHDAAGRNKMDRLVHTLVEWQQATCSGSSRTQRKATQKRGSVVLVGKEVVALALLPPAYFYPDGKAKDSILLQPACSKELYVAHGVAWPAQADVYQPPRDTDAVVAVPAFAGMRPAKDAPAFKDLYDWPKIHSSAVPMTAKTKWGDARRGVKRVLFEQKLRVCRVEARGVEGVQRALLLAAEVLADMRAEGRELVVAVAEYDEKGICDAEAPQHKDEPHDAPERPSNIIWAAQKACTNLLVHGPPEDVERELLAPVAAALRELGTPGSPAAEALVVVLHLAEVEHGRSQQLIPGRKPAEPRTDKQRQLLEKKKLADVLFLAQQ